MAGLSFWDSVVVVMARASLNSIDLSSRSDRRAEALRSLADQAVLRLRRIGVTLPVLTAVDFAAGLRLRVAGVACAACTSSSMTMMRLMAGIRFTMADVIDVQWLAARLQ